MPEQYLNNDLERIQHSDLAGAPCHVQDNFSRFLTVFISEFKLNNVSSDSIRKSGISVIKEIRNLFGKSGKQVGDRI